MNQIITILFSLISCFAFSQQVSSINSGAHSSNNLIYSVGEIFVLPLSDDIDDASSGTIGAISRIEFFTSEVDGIQDVLQTEDLRAYPNPTSNNLFIEADTKEIKEVLIYDLSGKLVYTSILNIGKIDLSTLQTGTYIIKADNPTFNSLTIIKK